MYCGDPHQLRVPFGLSIGFEAVKSSRDLFEIPGVFMFGDGVCLLTRRPAPG